MSDTDPVQTDSVLPDSVLPGPADTDLADTDLDASDDIAASAHHAGGAGPSFWIGAVLGWAIIAYGVMLLLADDEAEWYNTVRLAVIGLVAHDVVWLAASVGGGWLLSRLIGREIPFWIRWSGWTTAVIVALWLPVGRRYGDRLNNDTILPRNYTNSIVVLLVVIWVGGALYGVWSARRRGSESDQPSEV